LLKLAEDLLKNGLHTAEIVSGYQRAYEKTLEILPTLVVKTVDNIRDPDQLKAAIKSVIATKQYGYEDLLSELVVKACLTTFPPNGKYPKLNTESVRISKLRGGNLSQSSVVKGMVLLRDSEGLVKVCWLSLFSVRSSYYCGMRFSSAACGERQGGCLRLWFGSVSD
jgi:T-complex protein 1 subunit theta